MISENILEIRPADNYNFYNFAYSSLDGNFFLYNTKSKSVSGLEHCRELFARVFNKNRQFIGFHATQLNDKVKRINQFFNKREETLQIPEDLRTVIFKTNIDNVIILQISSFWCENSTRRSLFTLFLRGAATEYCKDGKFESFFNYCYAKDTKIAIEWFLKGNVYPTYKRLYGSGSVGFGGWVQEFGSVTPEILSKKLVNQPPTAQSVK